MNNQANQLATQFNTSQTKYVYYLLSISASCIAFSLFQTKEALLLYTHIPLGIAVSLWGLSFYFGCQKLLFNLAVKMKNQVLIKKHDQFQKYPDTRETFVSEMDKDMKKAGWYFKYQFKCLIWGAGFFIVWHVLEMYNRK